MKKLGFLLVMLCLTTLTIGCGDKKDDGGDAAPAADTDDGGSEEAAADGEGDEG